MAKVPGTFKTPQPALTRDLSPQGAIAEQMLLDLGVLHAERWRLGDCTVMAAREPIKGEYRWHVSIAHPSRYPTWDEMKAVLYGLECVNDVTLAQVIAPGDDSPWVNAHDNCFHWLELHDPIIEMRR